MRGKLPNAVEDHNLCCVTRGPQDVGHVGNSGPTNPTPLARAFYKAFRDSGRTLESLKAQTGLSTSTSWAYINGTRGGGGQPRQRSTIAAIARALGMDVEKTLALAGHSARAGVVDAIKADTSLTRRDKELLISIYEQRRR